MTSAREQDFFFTPLLSVGEAAKYLRVGCKVVYRLNEDDRIIAVR